MSLPIPQVGDVNVRGYMTPSTCGVPIEALQSLYGNQPPNGTNPLLFFLMYGEPRFPEGTEIVFDVVAEPSHLGISFGTRGLAANVRRA